MFNENEFIKLIKEKAKEKNLLKEVEKELELYKKYNQIEYLFIFKDYIDTLSKNNVPYILLRMAGASSVVAYVLGLHKINPIEYHLPNYFFFNGEYRDGGYGPRFDICVPRSQKEDAIKTLNRIIRINQSTSDGTIIRFGENDKYRIGIYGNGLLEILLEGIKFHLSYDYARWCKKELSKIHEDRHYKTVVDFMLKPDEKGYLLPNLNGCVYGIPSEFYELMEAAKPKDLYDLAKINCLNSGIFKNRKKLIKCIKNNGLDGTIYSREQFFNILVNTYDIDENDVAQIIDDVIQRNKLTEWEELTLRSHEVPEYIINQFDNIKYLYYMSSSLQEIHVAYHLSEIKWLIPGDFEKFLHVPYKNSFVGPFFYIDKKLYTYKDSMKEHNPNKRFFDADISHLSYFKKLGIDGDYGNYPRGRVIFDNFHKRFVVFLDKDLLKDDIKAEIIKAYDLEERQTMFKRDIHYTHDGL